MLEVQQSVEPLSTVTMQGAHGLNTGEMVHLFYEQLSFVEKEWIQESTLHDFMSPPNQDLTSFMLSRYSTRSYPPLTPASLSGIAETLTRLKYFHEQGAHAPRLLLRDFSKDIRYVNDRLTFNRYHALFLLLAVLLNLLMADVLRAAYMKHSTPYLMGRFQAYVTFLIAGCVAVQYELKDIPDLFPGLGSRDTGLQPTPVRASTAHQQYDAFVRRIHDELTGRTPAHFFTVENLPRMNGFLKMTLGLYALPISFHRGFIVGPFLTIPAAVLSAPMYLEKRLNSDFPQPPIRVDNYEKVAYGLALGTCYGLLFTLAYQDKLIENAIKEDVYCGEDMCFVEIHKLGVAALIGLAGALSVHASAMLMKKGLPDSRVMAAKMETVLERAANTVGAVASSVKKTCYMLFRGGDVIESGSDQYVAMRELPLQPITSKVAIQPLN